jgi:hypothetical protein
VGAPELEATMKVAERKVVPAGGIASLLGLAFCGVAFAQAPAGPVVAPPQPAGAPAAKAPEPSPLPPPRQSILGAWELNKDESDDARKRAEDSRGSNNGGYGGRRPGGGWPGGGGTRVRRGGYGGESDEQRQKMREFFSPPKSMTFSMTGAEVDLLDDRDRKRALMTDGRKLKKPKDDHYQEIAAKWDGNRLVTDEKDPRGNKMSRTFELSEDGRQLYETLHLKMGRSNTETSFRFVYDMPLQRGSEK